MKFKLVENFDSIQEGYAQLWGQFDQLSDLGVDTKQYDLHHIVRNKRSTANGKDNYIILPRALHKKFADNDEESINLVKKLQQIDPDNFHTVSVPFVVYTPKNIKSIVNQLGSINKRRAKNIRYARKNNLEYEPETYNDLYLHKKRKEPSIK